MVVDERALSGAVHVLAELPHARARRVAEYMLSSATM